METFDYIIVGAGSAGCVLANRLSADPANRVLLLEAGGEDSSYFIGLPKGFAKLLVDPKHIWTYPVRQARGNGADIKEAWTYGRGLGGSSSVNGMAYVRGQPADYEEWARQAGPEWGWAPMKQAFCAIEDNELGDDGVRGVGGAVPISTGYFRYPLTERLIAAGEQMGLKRKPDLNGEDQEGVGYLSHNIRKGKRQSASAAFLKPARRRPNLTVVTGAMADRLVFDGRRACAVDCRVAGKAVRFSSRGEIIVSAGTLQSPKLLQLSGIGPEALLRSHGIDIMQDSPDVGSRMRDHLTLGVVNRLKGGERGLNHRFRGFGLVGSLVQYLMFKTGPLAGGPMEVGVFAKAAEGAERPDVELMIGGMSMTPPDEDNPTIAADPLPGMTIYASMIRLTSEGSIRISAADPDAPLDIAPNWLSTEHDRKVAIATLRYVRRYLAQPAIAEVLAEELAPGPGVESDDAIIDWAYRTAFCGLHAVGTCRMGLDEGSVLDGRMRVRGVEGLRVVDCSAMPGRISGNTNGPAMAFAWRASDLILEDAVPGKRA